MAKERADSLLFSKGLVPSRERARTAIMAGLVFCAGQRVDKPGQLLSPDAELIIKGDPVGFVSRGGLKLEKALEAFGIDVAGMLVMDAGASTGGFTDCLLKRGASHVWAVDVGYGQLAWSLRQDERVTVHERTNVRHVTPELAGKPLDMVVADLSFISLKLVLPVFYAVTKDDGQAVCLVKPQFEAGRGQVGKKGVVRDKSVHRDVLERFADFSAQSGWSVKDMTFSPIRGPEGNIEYLARLVKQPVVDTQDNTFSALPQGAEKYDALVDCAFGNFDKDAGQGGG